MPPDLFATLSHTTINEFGASFRSLPSLIPCPIPDFLPLLVLGCSGLPTPYPARFSFSPCMYIEYGPIGEKPLFNPLFFPFFGGSTPLFSPPASQLDNDALDFVLVLAQLRFLTRRYLAFFPHISRSRPLPNLEF